MTQELKPKQRIRALEARMDAVEARLGGSGETTGDLVDRDWTPAVPALSALAHPARIAMLRLILRGEASTAADLAARDDTGTSGQVYHHLRQLVAAGWLRAGARGAHAVPDERVAPLLAIVGAAGA